MVGIQFEGKNLVLFVFLNFCSISLFIVPAVGLDKPAIMIISCVVHYGLEKMFKISLAFII